MDNSENKNETKAVWTEPILKCMTLKSAQTGPSTNPDVLDFSTTNS